jgi:chromosome segregation ATPase
MLCGYCGNHIGDEVAALPDNGGPRMRSEPLGALLASRGHITEEQLELALTEQKATGRPLGEIIVARGFAPPPTVAQALATQHGGLLKTEYGFATGWGGGVAADAEPAPVQAAPASDESNALRASLEEHKKALAAWQQAHKELQEKLAEAQKPAPPVDDPRLTRLAAERESMQAELTARDASIQQLQASLATVEAGRAELERALANEVERSTAMRAELAASGTSESVRAELDQRLAGLEDEVASRLQGAAAEFESARLGLEQQLTEARERVASLEAELATRDASIEQLQASVATVEAELAAAGASDSARLELERQLAGLEADIAERLKAAATDSEAVRVALEEQLSEAQGRVASLQADLVTRDASIEELQANVAKVEAELAAAGASDSARNELEQQLAGLEADIAERLKAAATDFDVVRVALEEQLTKAHERVASLQAEVATRDAELADLTAAPAGRWDSAQSHLVFFQGKEGYELHERSGPPPIEGSKVGQQMVARISSAPFPGSALPCAYLVA